MANQKAAGRRRAGFTVAELLLALAILVILMAVAIPSVVTIRNRLKLTELDNCAREIFAVAQNRMIGLRASGELDRLNAEGTEMPEEQPGDFPAGPEWEEVRARYVYVEKSDTTAELLLPLGSIDDAVRGGYYVIEYDKETAMVYGVFYAEEPFSDGTYQTAHGLRLDREARGKLRPMTGYYGGSHVDREALGQTEEFNFIIVNEDELYIKVEMADYFGTTVSYQVTVEELGNHEKQAASFTFTNKDSEASERTHRIFLDSLNGQRFWERFADFGFTPGADLKVTVEATEEGKLPAFAVGQTNSLYAWRDGNTAMVACSRHLQNLDTGFSQVTPNIIEAVQTDEITWKPEYGTFWSIENRNLIHYDGAGNEIINLPIQKRPEETEKAEETEETEENLGLFGTMVGGTLENIRLAGVTVVGDATTTTAGALAGRISNTTVQNCQAYVQPDALRDPRANALDKCYVDAAGDVGGLVGKAMDDSKILDSSASLPKVVGTTAGGLVGVLDGGTVSGCYADSGYRNNGAGGESWLGGATGTRTTGGLIGTARKNASVSDSYAAGYLGGALPGELSGSKTAAGFACTDTGATYSYCYTAAVLANEVKEAYGFSDGGTVNQGYYLTNAAGQGAGKGVGTPSDYSELTKTFSTRSGWKTATPGDTTPYGLDQEASYPFQRRAGLHHYGDWPEEQQGSALGVVYFERYRSSGGAESYGYFDAQGHSTLKGNDFTIVETGYGALFAEPVDITQYLAGPREDQLNTNNNHYPNAFETTAREVEGVGYLYPFTAAALQGMSGNLNTHRGGALAFGKGVVTPYSGTYCPDPVFYYVNPHFGAALTTLEKRAVLGTDRWPMQLRTQAQMANLTVQTTSGQLGDRTYWKQTHDIAMTGWTALAPLEWAYYTIDGGHNRITGLTQPLFDKVGKNFVLENLHIQNAELTLTGAGPCGILANTNEGTIKTTIVSSSAITAKSGQAAGFVGTNTANGRIESSYSNAAVQGRDAAGFAVKNGGTIANCYALLDIAAQEKAAGFLLERWDYGAAAASNCYAALSSIAGQTCYGFAPEAVNSVTNCFYLEQKGLSKGVGQSRTYDQLAQMAADGFGSGWTAATVARSHPDREDLQGKRYPFPLLTALDHYGDWPTKDLSNVELAYYEVYKTGGSGYALGLYSDRMANLNQTELDTLPRGGTVVQDGYVLLFRKDDKGNTSGGIPLKDLEESITLSWSTVTNSKAAVIGVDGFSEDLYYGGKKLVDSNGMSALVEVGGQEYRPLFLRANVVVTSDAAPDFYQSLRVDDGSGGVRTFWYNPHFAKSAVGVNRPVDTSDGITAYLRTERHFAALSRRTAYWKSNLTYHQERSLTMGTNNPYTETYFGLSLTSQANAAYRSDPYRIGNDTIAFQAAYDGEDCVLDLAGKTYTVDASGNMGVFGRVDGGTIENLTVRHVTAAPADNNRNNSGAARVGGLIGSLESGTVRKVTVESPTVTGNNLVGGAIGRMGGGTVTDLTVTSAKVTGGRLVGGVIGQLNNEKSLSLENITAEGGTTVSTGSIQVAMNNNNREVGFGTGGFAGACVSQKTEGVSLRSITVEGAQVTVGTMRNTSDGGARHGGAAFVGNLYVARVGQAPEISGVTLNGCTLTAASTSKEESAYGLLLGRVKSGRALALDQAVKKVFGCQLAYENAVNADLGGYLGSLTGSDGVADNSKLVLTLGGGSWTGLSMTCQNQAVLGGFIGRAGANTVLRGGGLTLDGAVVNGSGGAAGGFAGHVGGILSDVSVRNPQVSGSGDVGGLAGRVDGGELTACDVRTSGSAAQVSGESGSTGGFAGRVEGSGSVVTHCFAAIPVSGTGGDTGGFAGTAVACRVEECYASGPVSGGTVGNTGGFAGRTSRDAAGTIPLIVSCYASGAVDVAGTGAYAGGFAGRSQAGTILSCYSVGNVTVQQRWTPTGDCIGGFLGFGDGMTRDEGEGNLDRDALVAMVTFYNVLQTTKVVNRLASANGGASMGVLLNPGEAYDQNGKLVNAQFDTTDCRNVIKYLEASTIQIDSNVDGEPKRVQGTWDKNGVLQSNGSVTWNVVQTMKNYPELQNGTWMAQREWLTINGKAAWYIVVYWCLEDLDTLTTDTVKAYRYVSAEQSYYSVDLKVETVDTYGIPKYKRLLLPKDASFEDYQEMPDTLTIDGYYRYYENSWNWQDPAKETGSYTDHRYTGIHRELHEWFRAQAVASLAERKFKVMGKAANYDYPALAGAGCGEDRSQYIHHKPGQS